MTDTGQTDTQTFECYRSLLFSIAYRMLGSVMEAEDMVQEAYLRYAATDRSRVASPKAFLTTIVTRLCLDHLKSARVQREAYVGPWLPEPLVTEESPARVVEEKETISMAFLVLLEKLSPVERAIFLLREVFDYDYADIAQIVDKSEANCRQLYSRAKKYLVNRRPRFQASPAAQRQLISGFMRALSQGDEDSLVRLLAEDIEFWSDGGGRVAAARRPLHGRDAVVRFLFGIFRKRPDDTQVEVVEINGAQSLLIRTGGQIYGVMNFAVENGRIRAIRTVINPDKLRHLRASAPSD
jgi:RNA polymerase sigma-70 factor (ECF subfamily)